MPGGVSVPAHCRPSLMAQRTAAKTGDFNWWAQHFNLLGKMECKS